MTTLLQALVSAVATGSVYALLGVGISLSYKTTGVINFAHGDIAIVGAYVAFALVGAGASVGVGVLGGTAAGGLTAAVVERLVLRPLYGRPVLAALLVTVGIAVALEASIQLVWGSLPHTLPTLASSSSWHLSSISFSPSDLSVLLVAIAASLAIVILVERTRMGRGMRACAQDSEVASLLGVSPTRLYFAAFAIAGTLAGLSGVLIAPSIGLTPDRGLSLTVLGFAAAVLGGLGSLPGAIVGGILLAVLQNLAAVYGSPTYASAVAYAVLALVLLIRVRGILGDDLDTVRRV